MRSLPTNITNFSPEAQAQLARLGYVERGSRGQELTIQKIQKAIPVFIDELRWLQSVAESDWDAYVGLVDHVVSRSFGEELASKVHQLGRRIIQQLGEATPERVHQLLAQGKTSLAKLYLQDLVKTNPEALSHYFEVTDGELAGTKQTLFSVALLSDADRGIIDILFEHGTPDMLRGVSFDGIVGNVLHAALKMGKNLEMRPFESVAKQFPELLTEVDEQGITPIWLQFGQSSTRHLGGQLNKALLNTIDTMEREDPNVLQKPILDYSYRPPVLVTPLTCAIVHDLPDVFARCVSEMETLPQTVSINGEDGVEWIPLWALAQRADDDIFNAIIRKGNPDLLSIDPESGRTLFVEAVLNEDEDRPLAHLLPDDRNEWKMLCMEQLRQAVHLPQAEFFNDQRFLRAVEKAGIDKSLYTALNELYSASALKVVEGREEPITELRKSIPTFDFIVSIFASGRIDTYTKAEVEAVVTQQMELLKNSEYGSVLEPLLERKVLEKRPGINQVSVISAFSQLLVLSQIYQIPDKALTSALPLIESILDNVRELPAVTSMIGLLGRQLATVEGQEALHRLIQGQGRRGLKFLKWLTKFSLPDGEPIDMEFAKVLKKVDREHGVSYTRFVRGLAAIAASPPQKVPIELKRHLLYLNRGDASETVRNLSNIMSLLGAGHERELSLDSTSESITRKLKKEFTEQVQVEDMEQFSQSFDLTFAQWEDPNILTSYGMKITDKAVKNDLNRFANGVLDQSYPAMRYKVEEGGHLAALKRAGFDLKKLETRVASQPLTKFVISEYQISKDLRGLLQEELKNKTSEGALLDKAELANEIRALSIEIGTLKKNRGAKEVIEQRVAELTEKKTRIKRAGLLSMCTSLLKESDPKEVYRKLSKLKVDLSKAPFKGKRHYLPLAQAVEHELLQVKAKASGKVFQGYHIELADDAEKMFCLGNVGKTCQNVYTGDPFFSRALVGYALNGYNQLIAVTDANGEMVARAILRIGLTSDDKPIVLLERVYSAEGGRDIDEAIRRFAQSLASETFECEIVYARDYGLENYQPYEGRVHFLGGVSAYEYFDSKGGLEEIGLVEQGKCILDSVLVLKA